MNNKSRTILTFLLLVLPFTGWAQEGFGLWTNVGVTKKVIRGVSISLEGDFRSCNNLTAVDRWDIGLGINYKLLPWLKASAGYLYIYSYEPSRTKVKDEIKYSGGQYSIGSNYYSPYWYSRHRAYFDLKGEYAIGRFSFALRERYQYTYIPEVTTDRVKSNLLYSTTYNPSLGGYPLVGQEPADDDSDGRKTYDAEHKHLLRSKLSASYNIRKCKFDPFTSIECFNNLTKNCEFSKIRWTIGMDYTISKHHAMEFGYVLQHPFDEDEKNYYAISVGYSYKF